MQTEKSNIQHLLSLLWEIKDNKYSASEHAKKCEEAIEFAEQIEMDIDDLNDSVSSKKQEISELETQVRELEEAEDEIDTEPHFVGLDTLYIGYEKGNLLIHQQVEEFIDKLKEQNGVYANG